MRLVGLAAAGCAVLALVGCSKEVDGQPEASGAPLTKEQLFDPCATPDSVLLAAGLDPAKKDDNVFSVPRAEWKACAWRGDGYFITFESTIYTMEEIRSNTYFHDFKDVTVGDRQAVQYTPGERTPPNQCEIAFDTANQGRAIVVATKFVDNKSTVDPCAIVHAAAPHFLEEIPR
ncbi:DUF3558 domain-containing protein [Nocardia sp. AG03]|uniref:DUF3558 domain-containing protein n=1 Tax=Nocardia sp. AG03 TaxID=3025312 RepID=UPI00241862D4|nr:DUF3558 domain-containing protein [Nocardia sp. AG03]